LLIRAGPEEMFRRLTFQNHSPGHRKFMKRHLENAGQ
jgi:hypothetical protein